ncbi:copper P-type ATPase CtaA [Coprinopsis cinerea okayama7|uniref:P-type Cu(+) transporter n=1 Tax=Coprinopsis cinerea (strain Okayama-7 / 130 / ATCC MYA-4618 / FGSC 9003) TaxID=240176 RepID=A8N8V5_COPC7|nr:copper P-type ATPase CtaA [Coprinopsis cinerea okayama7\|eukprot:XP_001831283.1 copper P-type ATPase CtaA [Coprinopsis cinerea okayama7\
MMEEEHDGLLAGDNKAGPVIESCELRIEGMTCGACVEAIEGMLRDQKGIQSIKVALLAERGVVEYDPAHWTVPKIIEEISDIGFDATLIPPSRQDVVQLRIYGMTCGSCTSAIESGLGEVDGVASVSVSLAAESCEVRFDRSKITPREMVEHISDMGFDAILASDPSNQNATQLQSLTRMKEVLEWKKRWLWSLAFSLPVFFLEMICPMIPFVKAICDFHFFNGIYLGDILQLLIATPCQFWVGSKFYRNSYKSLKHGTATMDVLITMGTSAAYFYSVFVVIAAAFNTTPDYKPHLFFETSTMLFMFVSLGRFLENRAKGKTSAALTDLMSLAPSMATIYTDAPACTQEKKVPTELVEVGDIVKIVPGDKIPADGTVVKGSSSIDESAITGEAIPVLKQKGDAVIGGTVNGLGTFDMLVTRAGKDTALSQIIRLVEEAQTSKAPIQAFADRVAGYFVPAVIALAMITFLVWILITSILDDESLPKMFHKHGSSKLAVCLQMCISVVVVACPCALGLATPTAIMVGTGIGAKNGILIKGGRALEASRHVRRIVMDKTGTVTIGKLTVVGLHWVPAGARQIPSDEEVYGGDSNLDDVCADGVTSRKVVVAMVSATEARSEHPLAKAIATYGKELLGVSAPEATIQEFESITGQGVKAKVLCEGKLYTVYVGSSRFATLTSSDTTGSGHAAKGGVGSEALHAEQEAHRYIHRTLAAYEKQETSQGRTVIFVSVQQQENSHLHPQPILAVSLADEPKPTSRYAIQALEKMGIEVNMMTGDGRATAIAVARQVGIRPEGVWASMSPKGKAAMIAELMKKDAEQYGRKPSGVAMVGDGINDSPALVAATVGIALSSGTSVAIEAADIVLMRSDLLDVVAAMHLSRSIFATIRRNLIWACIYNVLGIPLAMGVFLPVGLYMHPMLAGAAMAFSSVSVVASSLWLKRWRRPVSSIMPADARAPGGVLGDMLDMPTGQTSGAGWTGLFVDQSATVLSSVGGVFSAGLQSARGLFGTGERDFGYSQLPVEMEHRDTRV